MHLHTVYAHQMRLKTHTKWTPQQQNCLCLFGVFSATASPVSLCLAVWRALAIDMSLYLFISQNLFLIITSLCSCWQVFLASLLASKLSLHEEDQLWHGVNICQAFQVLLCTSLLSITTVFTFLYKGSEQVMNLSFILISPRAVRGPPVRQQ